jgi:hypothetical protein
MILAALTNSAWMRMATMLASTIIVITGGCVAASVAGNPDRRWWAVVGGLIVAGFIVYVGFALFRSGFYVAYDPQ